jgi:hypothetical protein
MWSWLSSLQRRESWRRGWATYVEKTLDMAGMNASSTAVAAAQVKQY